LHRQKFLINIKHKNKHLNIMKKVFFKGCAAMLLFTTTACSQTPQPSQPPTSTDVRINEANFPDAKLRQYLSEQPYGSDGVITPAEFAQIKVIIIEGLGVADLKGIKYFTALEELHARHNQIKSFDFSGMKSLKILLMGGNQLTSINVSGLTNLQSLYCSNNQLTSINVSGLTNLEYLYLSANQFTSVDVSSLSKLIELYLGNNRFVSLNLSNLKNLVHLDLFNNLLKSIDVSALKNLQRLYCDRNELTSLNLTGLSKLTELECDNQAPKLKLNASGGNYSVNITLNNPAGFTDGISYANGTLTSTSSAIKESYFEVQTGYGSTKLSGIMSFSY